MADAADSKSAVGDHVGVQVPLSAPSLYCIVLSSSLVFGAHFTTSTACLSPLREGLPATSLFEKIDANLCKTFCPRTCHKSSCMIALKLRQLFAGDSVPCGEDLRIPPGPEGSSGKQISSGATGALGLLQKTGGSTVHSCPFPVPFPRRERRRNFTDDRKRDPVFDDMVSRSPEKK